MMTIGYHVKVKVAQAQDNWATPEEITRQLEEEIKSNLESLGGGSDFEDILVDVTMIGRQQS